MKLWMSAEVQDDVYDKNFAARKAIQDRVNERLQGHRFAGPWVQWAFIAIIMRKADAYNEVCKKNSKSNVLEFRLQLDRMTFKKATQGEANQMILGALARCLTLMREKKYAEEADVAFLESVLHAVRQEA